MSIRQKPTEAEQRELSSGGRAFLQYLCDAGISGDTASKLNDRLGEIRDGMHDQQRADLAWALSIVRYAHVGDPSEISPRILERMRAICDRMGFDPDSCSDWDEIASMAKG